MKNKAPAKNRKADHAAARTAFFFCYEDFIKSDIEPLGNFESEPNSRQRPERAQEYRRQRKNTPAPKYRNVSARD
jgi:hypothetical protein